jgi:hypothetical protein
MSTVSLFSLSVFAGVIAGISIITGTVLTDLLKSPKGTVFNFLGALIGLFGITGFYLWQRIEAGIFGVIAYIAVFLGLALIACIDFSGAFVTSNLSSDELEKLGKSAFMQTLYLSFSVFLVGVILFGIAVLRADVFSKIPTVLFMIGFASTLVRPVYPKVVFVGLTVAGSSLIWWSVALWSMVGAS